MKFNKKIFWRTVKITLFIYCAAGIALYYLQDKFLFHPEKVDPGTPYHFNVPFEELRIPFNEEDTMSFVKFFPSGQSKGIVLYFHGNMKNVSHYTNATTVFTKAGYEVWMEDYPGFGKSTGILTEEKLYSQALQLRKMADAKFSADSIIIYGKSLGTGIAAYTAANSKGKLLVLETPYSSMPDLFASHVFIYPTGLMSNYKIPTGEYVSEVAYPVVIFHGTADRVIPISCANKLKVKLKPGDKFYTIERADHQDINRRPEYFKTMDSLLQ